MENSQNKAEGLKMLKEKIKDIKVAMLTSVNPDGSLHSRPMQTQEIKDDGALWFFTGKNSGKIPEIKNDSHVSLGYADPDSNTYVAVCGKATLVSDQAKIDELWNDMLKAWFPEGKSDPNIILLKVTITSAEYWDSPSSNAVQLFGMVKAMVTGEAYKPGPGEHGKITA
ncbi:pyridoxamine 5'-phosphate oxidase family protein [Adhaeribacter sp. BT258]|uniref:Pyridoxamine 5'-phosphate oxidase family protein n=1 Tax=Adhaeribacter terrigena TaxID=2793070 RepID=A0ABS1C1J0_9BACT|nr:pyridoxamine 5'-phosphate oxidase family protein [Adhaeribacter terrigena]MBK0403041.1 pyridoxamine 5'-phosphate oxidase family protein [Adhaeribacter terrigena]